MLPKKYRGYKRRLRVKKSYAGLGLFTLETIQRKEFIAEYVGPILSSREADKKGGRYLFETNPRRIIDGSSRKNIARYINHSCKPNAEAENRHGRIYIFSKRIINAGEEITYNYGKGYFEDHIKSNGCRCPSCLKKQNKD